MPNRHRRTVTARANSRIDGALAAGAVAICAAAMVGFAWASPTREPARTTYQQTGALSYGSPAPAGSIYGPTGLTSGQPIYTDAVTTVTIHYTYRITSRAPVTVHGSEQLVAVVASSNHLTRTVPLQAQAATFKGDSFRVTTSMPLTALNDIVTTLSAQPGQGSVAYTVAISPLVHLRGHIGEAALTATFTSPVLFAYTSTGAPGQGVLTPAVASPAGIVAAPATGPLASSTAGLHSSGVPVVNTQGQVTVPGGQSATLFAGVEVQLARIVSLSALAVSLLVLLWIGRRILRDVRSDDEAVRIAARYGGSLVDVAVLPASGDIAVVEVSTFDALLKVAQKLECPILHVHRDGHQYAVVDSGTLYRYVVGASRLEAVGPQGAESPFDRSRRPALGGQRQ